MGWIVIIAFWVLAILLWIVDGPKIPLWFIALWISGLLVFPHLGWPAYAFMSYQAALAAVLLVIERYKAAF